MDAIDEGMKSAKLNSTEFFFRSVLMSDINIITANSTTAICNLT